ncbi:type II toxin-antitoxin system VapC family toxin [Candidatus Daviesbacteria bacterium]|nr:type II toxin-antitoxin system VapC family toxin [Candidatus Daviesbacteria bacterium]
MKLLVDTSVLIDHLRGGNAWKKVVAESGEDLKLFVPTIVIFELFSGQSTHDLSMVVKIYQLLDNFQKIELDENIAKIAGEFFRDAKHRIQVSDYIIAASALSINARVVTLNKKHFAQISGISIYSL